MCRKACSNQKGTRKLVMNSIRNEDYKTKRTISERMEFKSLDNYHDADVVHYEWYLSAMKQKQQLIKT